MGFKGRLKLPIIHLFWKKTRALLTSNDRSDDLPVDIGAGLLQTSLHLPHAAAAAAAAHLLPLFTIFLGFSSQPFLQLYDRHSDKAQKDQTS